MARTYTEEETNSILALQEALHGNPETRGQYLRLVKKVAPKTSIPEIDVPEQAMATLKPKLDQIDKIEQRLEASERRAAINDEWAKHRVSPAERVEVEKLMTDRLIADVGTAVEFHRTRQVQAAAPRPGPSTISMPTEGAFKGLFENPTKWARDEAYAAVTDLQAARS